MTVLSFIHPHEIVADSILEGDDFADAPPAAANYREAEIAGLACDGCAHFEVVGGPDENGVPNGVCHLWEAKVRGSYVCDRFTSPEPEDDIPDDHSGRVNSPIMDWFSDDDKNGKTVFELFMPGEGLACAEEDNLIKKVVLRTGTWAMTPSLQGPQRKPFKVVLDGPSKPAEGIVSLADIKSGFDEEAYEHVTVPLSHADKVDENTGYVKKLDIVPRSETEGDLVASIHFTDPKIRQKTKEGSIANTSVGLFYDHVRKSDGKVFPVAMAHSALTNRPWINGMQPFGIAASDDDAPQQVVSLQPEETISKWSPDQSFGTISAKVQEALGQDLHLSADYVVKDIAPGSALVSNQVSEMEWLVGVDVDDQGKVTVVPTAEWLVQDADEEATREDAPADPPEQPVEDEPALAASDDLRAAQAVRRRAGSGNNPGGPIMGATRASLLDRLTGVQLSDEQRAAIEEAEQENQRLRSSEETRQKNAKEDRAKKYAALFADYPGTAAKISRVFLSDDGGPAVAELPEQTVMLSDDKSEKQERIEKPSVGDVLADVFDSLPTKQNGRVNLSDMAPSLLDGDHVRPPADPTEENEDVATRTAKAAQSLGIKLPGNNGSQGGDS